MLTRLTRLSVFALALLLGACSRQPETLQGPLAVEARYRLLFNDTLVGGSLFTLQIGADGAYRIEAFTTPAGQMQQATAHEVLETSDGVIGHAAIQPARYEQSVLQGEQIELVSLQFDWDRHRLRVLGKDMQRDLVLPPGTHDRLSYLLAARDLAAAGEGVMQIQVASTEASEETRLEVTGREAVEVPLGHYPAVGIRHVTPDPDQTRQLWFDTAFAPLPLRVLQVRDGNTVEMQLEDFSRRPSDPH